MKNNKQNNNSDITKKYIGEFEFDWGMEDINYITDSEGVNHIVCFGMSISNVPELEKVDMESVHNAISCFKNLYSYYSVMGFDYEYLSEQISEAYKSVESNGTKSEQVLNKLTTYLKDSDISISSEKTDFGCLIKLYAKKDGDYLTQLEVHDCGYGKGYVMNGGWQGKKAVDKFNECTAMLDEETMDMIGSAMMGF